MERIHSEVPDLPDAPAETEPTARDLSAIARGEAEIEAGLVIHDDDLEAWLDALDRDDDAPMPLPRPLSTA